MGATATAQSQPQNKDLFPLMVTLAQSLDYIMRAIVERNTSELVRGIITPAVISFFKYFVAVGGSSHQHPQLANLADSTMHFLIKFLEKGNEWEPDSSAIFKSG